MKRLLLLNVFLLALIASSYGQRQIDEDAGWGFEERAYGGIGFGGLSIGRHNILGNYFSIGASVLGGYMLTKNLSSGVGFEYQYTSYSQQDVRVHLYGGYPFVRYNIKDFFVQLDYNLYSVQRNILVEGDREILDRLFLGAGYSSPTRGRGYVNFMISYDLLYTSSSPWSSPLNTRLFFTF